MSKLECKYHISERDMDMLFLQAFASEPGFVELFINKIKEKASRDVCTFSDKYHVSKIELSKSDPELGESDIEVVIEAGGKKYALLIEDKIDAIPMPKQRERYIQRGQLGKKNQKYDEFYDFIICPEKYTKGSNEANDFSFLVTYEECRAFFEQSTCPLKEIWIQQIDEALKKSKATSKVIINEASNKFLNDYANYLSSNTKYRDLNFKTNLKSNGWWIYFGTRAGNKTYIYHKTQEGEVELIFAAGADKAVQVNHMLQLVNRNIDGSIKVKKAGKSIALVKHVKKLDICKKTFDSYDKSDINECLDAVLELSDIADMMFCGKELL